MLRATIEILPEGDDTLARTLAVMTVPTMAPARP